MLKLKANPTSTFSAVTGGESLDARDWSQPWAAAYCKPRQEKALAWDLRRLGVSYFLPMVLRETSSGGRRRRNMYPLFASYLFLAAGEQERLAAQRTDRVVKIVEVASGKQPTFRDELASLETVLRADPKSVKLHPSLAPGTWVRVISGPMKDVRGVVIEALPSRKLWLGITALGVGATVEIPADLVVAD
jgi:transcription antitermination factor NusG